jgi:hypothetical protein
MSNMLLLNSLDTWHEYAFIIKTILMNIQSYKLVFKILLIMVIKQLKIHIYIYIYEEIENTLQFIFFLNMLCIVDDIVI